MEILVDRAMSTPRSLLCWKSRIEVSLADIRFETIDLAQSNIGIDRDAVWTISNNLSIFLVKPVEI